MAAALERGVTIITNTGGAGPRSRAEALLAAANESGIHDRPEAIWVWDMWVDNNGMFGQENGF